jgi:hypothetical protein
VTGLDDFDGVRGGPPTLSFASSMVSSWSEARPVKDCLASLGHSTLRASAFSSRPRPKVLVSSLCEHYDEPLWRVAHWRPEAEVARTTAPMPSRLEREPTVLTRSQRLRLPPSVRKRWAGPSLVVSTTSRPPSR